MKFDLDAGTYIPTSLSPQHHHHHTNPTPKKPDLTPLFNWNTKQLFVYVYATYPSDPSNPTTSAPSHSVIWDTIIPAPESPYSFDALRERFFPSASSSASNKKRSTKKTSSASKTASKKASSEPGKLRLRDQRAKYSIGDISGKMAERENVTLSVGWNVQPWVGALWWAPQTGGAMRTKGDVGTSRAFGLPALKGRNVGTAPASASAGAV